MISSLLAQASTETDTEVVVTQGDPISSAISIAILILMVVIGWKVYAKAGKPGWASIVPIYNVGAMMQIVGRPVWWILLSLVPL